ncbi:TetR/AcrR family transcriptional regulator [Rhodococcus triatomae]
MAERATRRTAPDEMRRRLVGAAVDCLVEYGFAGTTTQRVQTRAGVSRGALLHHFPSKNDMFVAAIRHVAEQRAERMRRLAAEQGPTSDRIAFAVTVLRQAMSGPLFLAGHELWMAARTDSALFTVLAPYERDAGRVLREVGGELFGPPYSGMPGFAVAFDSLVELLRGLAMTSLLRNGSDMEERVLTAWRSVFPEMCRAAPPPESRR